jgi:hypothetical protein
VRRDKSRFRTSEIPGLASASRRLERAIAWRVETALQPVQLQLDELALRVGNLERRLDERLPNAVRAAHRAVSEVERIKPHVAGTEQRLEELRQEVETRTDPGTSEEQREARRLVEEIRREHERIRARMTAIAWYEDRLRRVEERTDRPEGVAES